MSLCGGFFPFVRPPTIYTLQENSQKQHIECSHLVPKYPPETPDGKLPCVVYCHCNSGSRRDSEEALHLLLPQNVTVFSLDFVVSLCMQNIYTFSTTRCVVMHMLCVLRASVKISNMQCHNGMHATACHDNACCYDDAFYICVHAALRITDERAETSEGLSL